MSNDYEVASTIVDDPENEEDQGQVDEEEECPSEANEEEPEEEPEEVCIRLLYSSSA